MSRKVAFRQADVERAFKAAKAVGYSHPTVEIAPDGTLRVLTVETAPQQVAPPSALDGWRAKRGRNAA
jgi:hypothetical protein